VRFSISDAEPGEGFDLVRAEGVWGWFILDRIYKINKIDNKEWIPAFAGMTRLRLSRLRLAGYGAAGRLRRGRHASDSRGLSFAHHK